MSDFSKKNNSEFTASLANINNAKEKLVTDFDDGDITGLEYHRKLNSLISEEIIIQIKASNAHTQENRKWNGQKVLFAVVASVLIGILIGFELYPKLFGYSSAEECVLHAKHKYAVGACYDLYPRIQD